MGKNTFHPKNINWSYRYRGKDARTQTNKKQQKIAFNPNQKADAPTKGIYQPPKK